MGLRVLTRVHKDKVLFLNYFGGSVKRLPEETKIEEPRLVIGIKQGENSMAFSLSLDEAALLQRVLDTYVRRGIDELSKLHADYVSSFKKKEKIEDWG